MLGYLWAKRGLYMKVDGVFYRTIWLSNNGWAVNIIDQTKLPFEFVITRLETLQQTVSAIADMQVRGAPLIGATGAYGMALAAHFNSSDEYLREAHRLLLSARPTAVNLRWALEKVINILLGSPISEREGIAYKEAAKICDHDVSICSLIGDNGKALIVDCIAKKADKSPINILTHCNAGWLAAVDWGTALAPIYKAFDAGLSLHVWVDETRPRNQGASLTAWELSRHKVPHTVITDNAGGHLMQHGKVDLCIVGTDRTTRTGDVCNKIGTYLKALAAHDNNVPFYVALPSPTIDWTIQDGIREIPIEERSQHEVGHISGVTSQGKLVNVRIANESSEAANPAFDVTPSRLITGLITERGICGASQASLEKLFPEN